MNPLIDNFTKTLQPCGSCGKTDLADPAFDDFWKPKEKQDAVHNHETNSSGSGDAGGSGSEIIGG